MLALIFLIACKLNQKHFERTVTRGETWVRHLILLSTGKTTKYNYGSMPVLRHRKNQSQLVRL